MNAGREEGQPREAPYLRRSTSDREDAEGLITDLYLPNRLDLPPGTGPLAMRVAALRLGALTAGRLTYGQPVRIRTADARNVHMNIPLRGRTVSRQGGGPAVETAVGQGLVFNPGAPAEITWSADGELLCLMIPRSCLEAELERLMGRPVRGRLTFDFSTDLTSPVGRRWEVVLNLLANELAEPTDVACNPHVARHLEALVVDGLLLGQRHSHREAVVGAAPARPTSAIRHAVELLEERPGEPWTATGLAKEVHLSVRALQEGFRRDFDIPPMAYLREVRLRRAHEALQAAHRDTTTVGAVAAGLGILHLGRFAAAYRDAFGESPSETLNRGD